MILLSLILAGVALWMLLRDHKKDPGQQKSAKTVQIACLTFLAGYVGTAPIHLLQIAAQLDVNTAYFWTSEDTLRNTTLNFLGSLYHGFEFTLLVLVFLMTRRSNQARKAFLFILPGFAILEFILQLSNMGSLLIDVTSNIWAIVVFTFVLIPGTAAVVVILFASKFMREFFIRQPYDPFAGTPKAVEEEWAFEEE
jgi:hypothetical protein